VTGTDADLRKLSLDNARLVLLRFGVDEEVIQNMTRWDRIALVRKKSSEAAMQVRNQTYYFVTKIGT
jgi:transcription initiation factor TFIID subunit 1